MPDLPGVLAALRDPTLDGELFDNVSASFVRLLASMAVACAIALPLGVAMGSSARLSAYVDPPMEMLRPISGIAWLPLGLFIFGIGNELPVFLAAWQAWATTLPADTRAPSPAGVATAFARLAASGDLPLSLVQNLGRVAATQPVSFCHKVSLDAIAPGEAVARHGEKIGESTAPIAAGQHVHVHNMRSARAQSATR